ncbi:RNA polymerase II subunit A C-terminal domain phosphatase [Babesia sp. Xinjiang]|uniref:RNA polymerase II subunit A C-terminal domain phosphatase n=1 Tax=Babesia sp. Xinjiang TaxID=462227 RepID=UPI000A255CDF|nr:RNA polymerase II subunit A C-terminal domain phosphatase [Babesia sp. Xinjiang]ORM42316.1 RNA polymerase II subunit A C-terminal domain phosphatase [Babesia sp. Xinjiang]
MCHASMELFYLFSALGTFTINSLIKLYKRGKDDILKGFSVSSSWTIVVVNVFLLKSYAWGNGNENIVFYYWVLILANFVAGIDDMLVYDIASNNIAAYDLGASCTGVFVSLLHWCAMKILERYKIDVNYGLIVCHMIVLLILSLVAAISWTTCMYTNCNNGGSGSTVSSTSPSCNCGFWTAYTGTLPMTVMSTIGYGMIYVIYPRISPFEMVQFDYQYPIQKVCTVLQAGAGLAIYVLNEQAGLSDKWKNGKRYYHLIWLLAIPYLAIAFIFIRIMHYPQSPLAKAIRMKPWVVGFLTVFYYFAGRMLIMIACVAIDGNAKCTEGSNSENTKCGMGSTISSMNLGVNLLVLNITKYISEAYMDEFIKHRKSEQPRSAAAESSNLNHHGKPWTKRQKQSRDAWQGMPKAAQPFPKNLCPPFGMMPPMMPKQGGAPVLFPFMGPAVYQNMMKNAAGKAPAKAGEELDMKAMMAKMPFPLPKNIPMMGLPPPNMMYCYPPSFYPKNAAKAPRTGKTPGNSQLAINRRNQQSRKADYVNLADVTRSGRAKRARLSAEDGSENMSVISNEASSDSSEGSQPMNLTFVNTFVPSPPERYRRDYELHEIKMFSPLGIRAHAKAKQLSPEVVTSFESGPVKNGKLVLLLDLDNTLLHACSQTKLDMLDLQLSHFVDELGEPELFKFTMPNFANTRYYMKLRPGLRGFLQVLSLYYEMSIYTNATKEYADVVVSILDPDRSLFMDRIVARTNVGERDLQKTAARLYPNLDPRYVVAFDDRADVWADVPYNQVVKAEHYDFFDSHLAELTDAYGIVLPNTDNKPYLDNDRHLEHMVKVFLELHKRFFEDPFNASVGEIVEDMQSQVLNGVGILLTGYRKNSKGQVLQADCEQKQKEIATEMGAIVVKKLSDKRLTHVVAGKNCTDNVVKSMDPSYSHVHKVHTLWLYSCKATWSKVPPEKFNVDEICEAYGNEPPQQPCKDHWKVLIDNSGDNRKVVVNDTTPEDQLPTRIFMGTGSYSHGTELISPSERVVIRWDPAKTKLLQNNSVDPIEQKCVKQMVLENAPYTNSVNTNIINYE